MSVEGWNYRGGGAPQRAPSGRFTTCAACGFNCGYPPEAVVEGKAYHARCTPQGGKGDGE